MQIDISEERHPKGLNGHWSVRPREDEISSIAKRGFPTIYIFERSGRSAFSVGDQRKDHLPPAIAEIVRQLIERKGQSSHTFIDPDGEHVVQLGFVAGSGGSHYAVLVTPLKPRGDMERNAVRHNLTRRETDVVRALANGDATEYIAETLQIAPTTVMQYIKSAMLKTNTHSRLELFLELVRPHQAPAQEAPLVPGSVVRMSQSAKST